MNNSLLNLFAALSLFGITKTLTETEQPVDKSTGKLPEYILGEDDIKVGDRFYGYSCTVLFENQVCSKIDKNGLIYGTTTLAIFNKKYIKKY